MWAECLPREPEKRSGGGEEMLKPSRTVTSVLVRLGLPTAVFCLAGIFAATVGWQSSAQSAESVEQVRVQTEAPTLRAENGATLFVAGAVAVYAEEPKIEQCLEPEICPIPYVRLAKQETEPFLFLGKVVDEDHPRSGDYKRALRRFPDVRSCLVEKEREKPKPDLRQIDWDKIRNIKDIDVCVFRIASSIEDIENIKLWLLHHDFRVGKGSRINSEDYVPKSETDRMFGFSAILSVERFREILPQSWFARIFGIELMRSYWLTISFSQSGQVVDVSSGGNSKLN